MSTSADQAGSMAAEQAGSGAEAGGLTLRPVRSDDELAQQLIEKVQLEYVARYGGRDAVVVAPEEFAPPHGLFLVAELHGEPVGCGAWRALPEEVAEIKRVYVEPAFRRRGVAATVMAALEADVARAGLASVVLNTGEQQPEAVALYAALGYQPVEGYGIYAGASDAVFLGKDLRPAAGQEARPWAS